ncbi:MAG: hypothetical protein MJ240_14005, partial [Kiritimatiellae bacterium]|nr:hypothetical protein [Kiritimatiellia bacterium]
MKFNGIRSFFLWALMVVLMAPTAWAGGKHYASLTTTVATGSGAGKVYASKTDSIQTGSFAQSVGPVQSDNHTEEFNMYAYAFPSHGYRFAGWSQQKQGAATYESTDAFYAPLLEPSQSNNQTKPYTYYAYFAAAEVKDIHLCVGDTVRLYFHNATSKTWLTSLNEAFVTGAGVSAGRYSSFQRSTQNASQAFNVLITATGVSGSASDNVTVMDWNGNTYNYRIHVAA